MKKNFFTFLAFTFLLTGCGTATEHIPRKNTVEDALRQRLETTEQTTEDKNTAAEQTSGIQPTSEAAEQTSESAVPTSEAAERVTAKPEEAADDTRDSSGEIVDLTVLDSDMVYAVVFEMMNDPQKYMGKTIKMSGTASRYTDVDTGADYYACIITDAQACCAQGIEYKLPDGEPYPDYGSGIIVTGTFGSYTEGENVFYVLNDAQLEIVAPPAEF